MSEIMGVNLNLNQEYIKSSVEEIVKASIIQALGDPGVIVKSALDKTINQKVGNDGNPSTSWSAKPYLNWLAEKVIEKTIRDQLVKYVEDHSEEFKAEILRQISSKKFKQETAGAFIQAILQSAEYTWKMPVSVSFELPKED